MLLEKVGGKKKESKFANNLHSYENDCNVSHLHKCVTSHYRKLRIIELQDNYIPTRVRLAYHFLFPILDQVLVETQGNEKGLRK